jgi:mannose-6-phosphate isomerase-like protein (cupin superfamily)
MNDISNSPIFSKAQVKQPIESSHGETVFEMIGLDEKRGGAKLHSLAHIVIAQGKASLAHHHKISEESFYILHGRACMEIDGHSYHLNPGQACLIMPGQTHQIFNDGDQPLEFLAICAPAWYPEDSYFVSEDFTPKTNGI